MKNRCQPKPRSATTRGLRQSSVSTVHAGLPRSCSLRLDLDRENARALTVPDEDLDVRHVPAKVEALPATPMNLCGDVVLACASDLLRVGLARAATYLHRQKPRVALRPT
jgi:hypothetical protein